MRSTVRVALTWFCAELFTSDLSGDILFFRTLGQSMIILGNPRLAFEFLEKRSSNYSDRPISPMFDL